LTAIGGLVHRDGQPADEAALQAMRERLAHRGPDASGAWRDGPAGLIQCLLKITPESLAEQQPLASEDGRLVITADARLDNRAELCAALGLRDEGQPDAALILAGYARWGEGCAARLLGDFAFAIWDGAERKLYGARDYIGVKPFYYHLGPGLLAFASEIKGLFALPGMPRRLNEVRAADYLLPYFEDRASTFYEDILRLPAGHCLSVSAAGARTWAYYTLQPQPELRLGSDEAYAEAFRAVFAEAVGCRLRSAHQVGAMLSGGLDSSAVACQARALRGPLAAPLPVFSAIFDEVVECDERPYIEAVLAGGGMEAHYIHADQLSPLADLERMQWHMDEPFYAPNLFIDWAILRAGQAAGVRVMLDGQDGDSTVSHGLGYLTELARAGRWARLWHESRALARHFETTPRRVLWRQAVRPLLPQGARRLARRLRGQPAEAWRAAAIHPDFARRLGWPARVEPWLQAQAGGPRGEREAHLQKLSHGLHPFYLEVGDREAAAFGLEVRSPFYDRRLVELCLSLPADQKLRDGWTRWVMRRALHGVLPPEVEWRGGKSNLGPNFRRGLLRYEGERLARWAAAPGPLEGYVDVPRLRAAWQRYQAAQTEADALVLWRAVTLGEWLEFAFGLS
jgi:asparagine synthase (glutamine-hydrolysing)